MKRILILMVLLCFTQSALVRADIVDDITTGDLFLMQSRYGEASISYRNAAEKGNMEAQFLLGKLYESPLYGFPNDVEAVKWFRRAAEQGHKEAQAHLGKLYFLGKGVLQDFVLAHMWFNIAARNRQLPTQNDFLRIARAYTPIGEDPYEFDPSYNRDVVAKKMTAADISEAQKRAKICVKSNYKLCD